MKKLLLLIVVVLTMCFTAHAAVDLTEITFSNVNDGKLDKHLRDWFGDVNDDISTAAFPANVGTGKIFYVDSGAGRTSSADGLTPSYAVPTLDDGINLCTANRGDVIYVMQGHTEAFGTVSVTGVTSDTAGVIIKGLGIGDDAPTFTFSVTDATWALSADNVLMSGLRFIGGVDGLGEVHADVPIQLTGGNNVITGCEFTDTSTFNTTYWIQLGSAADGFKATNNVNKGTDTAGNVSWITTSPTATADAIDNIVITGNTSNGDFSSGNFELYNASLTNATIEDNKFENANAVDVNIQLSSGNTGWVSDNYMRIATQGQVTWINPTNNGMSMFENYGSSTGSASGHLTPSKTVY